MSEMLRQLEASLEALWSDPEAQHLMCEVEEERRAMAERAKRDGLPNIRSDE